MGFSDFIGDMLSSAINGVESVIGGVGNVAGSVSDGVGNVLSSTINGVESAVDCVADNPGILFVWQVHVPPYLFRASFLWLSDLLSLSDNMKIFRALYRPLQSLF